jgi:hypothetical protein
VKKKVFYIKKLNSFKLKPHAIKNRIHLCIAIMLNIVRHATPREQFLIIIYAVLIVSDAVSFLWLKIIYKRDGKKRLKRTTIVVVNERCK